MLTSLLASPGGVCKHWWVLVVVNGLGCLSGLVTTGADEERRERNESDSNLLSTQPFVFIIHCQKGDALKIMFCLNRQISSLFCSRSDMSSTVVEFLKVFFAICTLKDMRKRWKTGLLKDHCCAFFEIHSRSALKQRLIVVITDIQSGWILITKLTVTSNSWS